VTGIRNGDLTYTGPALSLELT